jgi:hypothetical protein
VGADGDRPLTLAASLAQVISDSRVIIRMQVPSTRSRVAPMPATAVSTSSYPPLNVQVHTPRLSLLGATDELLERLLPVVRKGVVTAAPWPFDDPMSLYQDSPER